MFPEVKPSGTLMVEGKQNLLFPEEAVIKCFVIPPNPQIEKKLRENDLLNPYGAVPAVRMAVKPSCPTEMTQHAANKK